jgi:hypothetical protein
MKYTEDELQDMLKKAIALHEPPFYELERLLSAYSGLTVRKDEHIAAIVNAEKSDSFVSALRHFYPTEVEQ